MSAAEPADEPLKAKANKAVPTASGPPGHMTPRASTHNRNRTRGVLEAKRDHLNG
eukprot:CAMPEP_0118951728 /NCGR_PEP_ID=MMETSP1169-20130426/53623_1 /TAXON_ID=36882 /ORGANISM="Pyramimonas obovata, Strain CCMP722" /LENGTH=54 /DNA_ID=CAMNT_0006898839 /DNA_START=73 /DNA_END=237 /DNA_ORIENTATION=-